MMESLKRIARKSKLLRKLYKATKSNFPQTHIYEITRLHPRTTDLTGKRLNLLIPTINQEYLFGGISTAITFLKEFAAANPGTKQRIILTDSSPESSDLAHFPEYAYVTPEEDSMEDMQILAYNDRSARKFPVSKDDIFIATAWWTAYIVQQIMRWQAETYEQDYKKIVYFIQDFEPGFYPWSSQYALADSTYRYKDPQVAIFNTSILRDFFYDNGYRFSEEYVFQPKLNKTLKQHLQTDTSFQKKKQILIYGRPSVARNAFTLIIEALRIWVIYYPNCINWEIVSAGENHPDIDIGNGVKVRSKGKMTLHQYAETLKDTSIGISLMISPHPSYPPLEMAHFGAVVLTNHYANKDLSDWHDNIISLDTCSPDNIASNLIRTCHKIEIDENCAKEGKSKVDFYLDSKPQFEFLDKLIRSI